MHRSRSSFVFSFPLFAAIATAQEPITEARVLETVSWLAADERRGRDTGSPELEQAADWIAERFAKAGLKQVKEGAWFHEYSLPGLRVDSRTIALKVVRKVGEETKTIELQPDADVRLWRAGEAGGGENDECVVDTVARPAVQRMLDNNSARKPVVLAIPEDHPYWKQAAGARNLLVRQRTASRPVFLVRESLLEFPAPGEREATWTATWSAPAAEKVDVPLRNVVALLPGAAKKEEYVVVSAHYDHIGTGAPVDGDAIYNGADDDATGTTAVMLIAEAMQKQPPPARSVLFVCFSAEERGLKGSAAFVERPPVPRDQIVANLNLEMLGRPERGNEKKAWVTGPRYSDFASIVGAALERGGVQTVDFKMADQLFSASDNWSFAQRGIVAHSVSAGSLHRDYHQPADEVEALDIAHMTAVIQALVHAVRELADRDAAPAWTEAGQKVTRRR